MNPRNWPLWLRCQIIGLASATYLYVFVVDGRRTVFSTLVCLVVGVTMGLALWRLAHVQERRVFGDLSESERVSAVRAVLAARPPQDPRLCDVATRIAARWAKPRWQIVFQIVIWALAVALSIYLGIVVTSWGWAGLVFCSLAGWLSVRAEVRRRRAGRRFLDAAGAAAPAVS